MKMILNNPTLTLEILIRFENISLCRFAYFKKDSQRNFFASVHIDEHFFCVRVLE